MQILFNIFLRHISVYSIPDIKILIMTNTISIVSAFFKINRGNWKGFERTDYEYLDYFKSWAKLKNKLVVYVETEDLKNEILQFRASLGLENQTIVNVIDRLDVEPELYNRIIETTQNPIHKIFRLFPNNPECWNGNYNYIMLMKTWCVCDAIAKKQVNGMVAWVDFGYNHGGAIIDKESNFNFLWEYDFPKKMNLFSLHAMDKRPIFEMVMSMDTYLMGSIIVGVDTLWPEFWKLMKSSVNSLCDCGLCDDDQNVMLMAFRKNPMIFNIIESDWNKILYQFGGQHLILKKKVERNKIRAKIGHWVSWFRFRMTCIKYAYGIYKHMSKVNLN